MCGIVGIFCSKGFNVEEQRATGVRMAAAVKHRGPDAWGIYCAQNVVLAHTRLSIIDISAGHQPMITDRYVVSFNGEIFNYIELMDELKKRGVVFSTHSDTEVIIKVIEEFGVEGIKKFNGQFSFLLWDKKAKKLIVCRDRYGMQPLYVLQHGDIVYFASEMKAFDEISGFTRTFDSNQLQMHGYLWNTIGDATVYKDIRSVRSGTFEIYTTDKPMTVTRYYEIGETWSENNITFDDAVDEFYELLEDAIKLRLRSDVPVANYLSGGLDSSVITFLTSFHNKKHFQTFSVAFDDPDFDESSFQKELVGHIKANHHEEKISYKTIDSYFGEAIYHTERPLFRTAPIPMFMLSQAVRKNGYRVVLTGEAADEILFGYDSFKELKLMQFWGKNQASKIRPLLIKKLYPHLRHFSDPRRFGLMKLYYEGFLDSFDNDLAGLNIRAYNNHALMNYFNKETLQPIHPEIIMAQLQGNLPEQYSSWSLLRRNQFLEMRTLLSGYLLSSQGDRMTMSHGIEARYPFLDHRLVEKVFSYNDNYKLNGFSQKHLMKKAFERHLPASIINRPKMPYQAPDLKSFVKNGRLTENAENFLSPQKIKEYGLFDPVMVARFLKKTCATPKEKVGYRDNMLITFILSSQLCCHWIKNPKKQTLVDVVKTVDCTDR